MGWVGRPRRHDTEAMLDAARSIALESGARAVTVDAIAALSGASVGSLYNRFGSRDKILTAAWQRALERFQEPFLDQLRRDDLDDAALGAARWIMEFARTQPEDARLLAAFRPADVLTDPNALRHGVLPGATQPFAMPCADSPSVPAGRTGPRTAVTGRHRHRRRRNSPALAQWSTDFCGFRSRRPSRCRRRA
ncbi:bacterial regulatory s, tetR family protein [Mycobacterium kansasii]|uniref:Bacterial regulatory s, tetR family protein n=1 Tax=Mycobacterium kansasii TaxID=1768 RepID=A0A1V3WXR1_MYCKA|nr:bacterial regulatory s, tetR family protein [Mycobacterium kansasii]